MFLLAHLQHCFSVLSLSKFIFNIRFQIAVLVCSIDTERNKNKQGAASLGTACLLEIFFFLILIHLVHVTVQILISKELGKHSVQSCHA